jgi:hypothetical protein
LRKEIRIDRFGYRVLLDITRRIAVHRKTDATRQTLKKAYQLQEHLYIHARDGKQPNPAWTG